MFTGIVESLGRIAMLEKISGDVRLYVEANGDYLDSVNLGDSVAVSGVCLTVVQRIPRGFAADVSVGTLDATTAKTWRVDTPVNLERALTPAKPLGGHMMSGHVDGVGHLVEMHEDARSWRLSFEVPQVIARYIARKGSVAVDGISLTVNEVQRTRFGVNIIPQTWTHTTLCELEPGGVVNLEVDLIARYLERLVAAREEV